MAFFVYLVGSSEVTPDLHHDKGHQCCAAQYRQHGQQDGNKFGPENHALSDGCELALNLCFTRLALPESRSVASPVRFCERKIPARVRDQLVWEVATRGRSITIYERRPPWPGAADPGGPWTKREIAQFRLDETDQTWSLYWADRNGRWLLVPDAAPAPDINDLLRVVDENRSGAFD